MASPVPVAPMGGPWTGQHTQPQPLPPPQRSQQQHPAPSPAETDEAGVQVRPMGHILPPVKVHYTFDKDAKVNCLARFPHTLQIQTIPIDETTLIGIVDLRPCIHAVMECSPELAGQETDYTIYALDFSEPDTPLVGQGMLSWALDSLRNDAMMHQPKMVTGRVTKNLLGVFGGSNRETLEVRLRLSVAARPNPQIHHNGTDMAQNKPVENVMTPTGTAEWNSFMQSNPHFGQSQPPPSNVSRVASPALPQGQIHQPITMGRRDSFGPAHHVQQTQQQRQEHLQEHSGQGQAKGQGQELQRIAPMPVELSGQNDGIAVPSSRPSSRASNRGQRVKQPTGRPRGRPKKKAGEGNTSGYEDGTEGEDAGPVKKRIKTTVVERASSNVFANGPESLRVAASTSGSLRSFRPVLVNTDTASSSNSHLQEIPRAPTPVPDGPSRRLRGRGPAKQESALSQQPLSNNAACADPRHPLSPGQEDGRSPDSLAPTPAYSVDSPADIGSSPPVQRATPFIRSSPPPSSPVLPPMPSNEPLRNAATAATDDLDDLFGDEPPQIAQEPKRPRARRPREKPTQARNSSGVPVQVFQMQDGPCGQDLVHIYSYNTVGPSSTPAQAPSDSQSLPPLEKPPPPGMVAEKSGKSQTPPAMPPTPPPTTDAAENSASPVPAADTPVPPPALPLAPTTATEEETETTEDARQSMATVASPVIAPEPVMEPSPPAGVDNSNEEESGRKDGDDAPPPAPPAVSKAPRQLARCRSAGPLALPSVPASEPAGPSSLSRSAAAEQPTLHAPPAPSTVKRAASSGPLALPIPASDPVVPAGGDFNEASLSLLVEKTDAIPPPPPSSPPVVTRSNKNNVKKHAIKQRLEAAVMNGEMPPYCCNCGAIETPTWRKIWVQEKEGVPEYCEYSVEPGRITAIEILRRDADEKPTLHRLVKKSLGAQDDKTQWQELLLCNPCGIWLTKCKSHRPQDRWDKDASRLGQERKKRGSGRNVSRAKRSRAKSGGVLNPTSEAYLPTDALGPVEPSSLKQQQEGGAVAGPQQTTQTTARQEEESASLDAQETRSNPGSTHSGASRGSGTVGSPIDVEFDAAVGSTKRLLFPSPRKEGVLKTLGELHVNIVQTPDECRPKEMVGEKGERAGKENSATTSTKIQSSAPDDGLEALFKSPTIARPCTPPPNAKAGASKELFKTPTQATPNHRPITRSISRSIRSIRSIASPGQAMMLLQRTPTKTPPVAFGFSGSASRRRSSRNHQGDFEIFDTPISRTINLMFSDGAVFGENDLDLSNLPSLDGDGSGLIEFGNLLSTDGILPSSPPKDGSLSFDYLASTSGWPSWDLDTNMDENSMDTS
ncbi:hypothetical protein E4U42_006136 [Claviceps africana]|uniref:Ams2/SPT21 N-terminal domain-containing protein n=1 Tax=Claviceps africana TaxID=83212 RepID=A0A8K0J2R4_9HYPO|nr:hypothetical protein E4U42_006136 [Claviceps africana]